MSYTVWPNFQHSKINARIDIYLFADGKTESHSMLESVIVITRARKLLQLVRLAPTVWRRTIVLWTPISKWSCVKKRILSSFEPQRLTLFSIPWDQGSNLCTVRRNGQSFDRTIQLLISSFRHSHYAVVLLEQDHDTRASGFPGRMANEMSRKNLATFVCISLFETLHIITSETMINSMVLVIVSWWRKQMVTVLGHSQWLRQITMQTQGLCDRIRSGDASLDCPDYCNCLGTPRSRDQTVPRNVWVLGLPVS